MGTTNAERQAKHRQRVKAQMGLLRNEISRLNAELASAYGTIAQLRSQAVPPVRHEVFCSPATATRKAREFRPDWTLIDRIIAAMDARKMTRGKLSKALFPYPAKTGWAGASWYLRLRDEPLSI